jgi:amino acid transporter
MQPATRSPATLIAGWNLFAGLGTMAVMFFFNAVSLRAPGVPPDLPERTQRVVTWLMVYVILVLLQVAWWAARRLRHSRATGLGGQSEGAT